MLARYAGGQLTPADRVVLDHLIDEDYQDAIAHADRLIAAKRVRANAANGTKRKPARVRSIPKSGKQLREMNGQAAQS
jgi:hypothetical protein